jgi:hypothetical protein
MNAHAMEPKLVLVDPSPSQAELFSSALANLDPVGALFAALTGGGEEARATLRSLARGLIDEGERYATTPAGARWASVLADSPAVRNGWFLWNQANVDFHLRNAATLPDSPAKLLEAVLGHLATLDLEGLAAELGMLAAEIDASHAE